MSASVDTIVVGGGLVGAAVAWGLAREGEEVTVIDEGDIALRASRGNFGLVWVQTKGKNLFDYARWSRRSADLWPEFAGLLEQHSGVNPDYHKAGGVHLCLSEEELDQARALNNRMHNVNGALGYGAEILDRKQLDEMIPGLGPDVVGGSYGQHDGHTSPLRLLRGLHGGLKSMGATYASDGPVLSVAKDGDGYVAKTASSSYRGAKIVLAAGHGNKALGQSLGLDIPIHPEKGQILVTERVDPFLNMPTHVIRQTDEGTVMMGDSHEHTGYSDRSTAPVMSDLARNAVRCFPILSKLKIIRSWGAVRILSPDGAPIYQESETCKGAFSVNCHSGVTLAGAHAMALAPMIAAGKLDPDFEIFLPGGSMAKRIENTGEPVQFTFDGQTVTAQSGDTVAAALTAAGIDILRSSVVSGAPRGVFCMMGTCFDCLVEVDGVPNRQACQIPVTEGLTVCSQQGAPEVLEARA